MRKQAIGSPLFACLTVVFFIRGAPCRTASLRIFPVESGDPHSEAVNRAHGFSRPVSALQIDLDVIPHYLVLRTGCQPYVLNAERRVLRREASRLLHAFARTRGALTSIANDEWNDFSGSESISPAERAEVRAYALVCGAESEHQLRLLADL